MTMIMTSVPYSERAIIKCTMTKSLPSRGCRRRGRIEVAAAALITGFGVPLLCGYLVNERMLGL